MDTIKDNDILFNIKCEKEYIENICDNCEFKKFELVSHPGGSSVHSVKKYYCELEYWKDDF
jgi:hypothetical protein